MWISLVTLQDIICVADRNVAFAFLVFTQNAYDAASYRLVIILLVYNKLFGAQKRFPGRCLCSLFLLAKYAHNANHYPIIRGMFTQRNFQHEPYTKLLPQRTQVLSYQ